MTELSINLDASEFQAVMAELLQSSKDVLKMVDIPIGLFDDPDKLARFERSPAVVGAGITFLLKPSDLLLDYLAAVRAAKL